MKFVEFLEGKWLGHPLHPAIVHVPVGGWILACGLDVAVWAGADADVLPRVATWAVGLGLAVALVAIAPGFADWAQIKKEKPAWKLGLWHMLLNVLALAVWSVNFWLRFPTRSAEPSTPVLVTSIIGALLVFVSAYIGSLMVFDHGIGVARFSKKEWRERAKKAGAHVPQEK